MPVAERQRESEHCRTGLLPGGARITGRIAGVMLVPARALTWAGEPLRRKRGQMPELMGKLGTSVNGPEGLPSFDGDAWDYADWRFHEEQVRRLRGRIFKAVQDGDWPLARNLQKLMLRSWSNTLVIL